MRGSNLALKALLLACFTLYISGSHAGSLPSLTHFVCSTFGQQACEPSGISSPL